MTVRYSGHLLQTRRQAAWQSAVLLLVLVPLVIWRFTTHPPGTALALAALTTAPFSIAYQASRFLREQEQIHSEPTAGMAFVFRFVANTPLTLGALIFVLLIAIG
jgi:hypothetical protein